MTPSFLFFRVIIPGVYTYTPYLSFLFLFLLSQDGGYWWFIGGLLVVYWWLLVVYWWLLVVYATGLPSIRYFPGVLHPFLIGNKAGFGVNVLKLVLQSCELQLRIKVALIRDNFSWALQLGEFVTVAD